MKDRLFDDLCDTNPNARIMIVEQQEGYDEEDTGHSLIGDATMKHVQSLSGDASAMIMWNELIHMPDGNMFKTIPSWDENDRDPYNMRGKELSEIIKQFPGISEADMLILEEALSVEQDRRESAEEYETEDALDQEIIPYDEWEKFPGMWEKMELCSTPPDRFLYMGNTRQQHYDEFPEHHPDASKINNVLMMINRKYDIGLSQDYADWMVDEIIMPSKMREYVKKCLVWLVNAIAQNNDRANNWTETKRVKVVKEELDEDGELQFTSKEIAIFHDGYVQKALKAIDKHWRIEYNNKAASKTLKNPMTALFLKKEKEWNQQAKEGFSPYGAIKQFGQLLFSEFKNKMTGYHWARYRRARNKHAPRVILRGKDINRCSVCDLQKLLRIDEDKARDMFMARPFISLEDAYSKGFVSANSFADDEKTDKIIEFIEKHTKIACEHGNAMRMNDVRKILFDMQKEKKGGLNSSQWSLVWKFYNLCKAEVLSKINA